MNNDVALDTSPLYTKSFGNIDQKQAENILTDKKIKAKAGNYIIWYSEEENIHKISCIDKNKKIIHIDINSKKYRSLVSKVTKVSRKNIKKINPVSYYSSDILSKQKDETNKDFLLEQKTLKKVLKIGIDSFEPGRGVMINKERVTALEDRKVVVILDRKVRIYEIFEDASYKIGEGGQGCVYKVRDLRNGKMCAHKLGYQESKTRRGPELEGIILKKIHARSKVTGIQKPFHSTVKLDEDVEAYSSFGHLYQTDLFNFINENFLTRENIKDIFISFIDIFKGLKQCHAFDIVHNDIKPENIFVETSKKDNKKIELYLADWGLAYDFDNLPKPLRVVGSAEFSSFEDFEQMNEACALNDVDELKMLSKKRDVYSLGESLYVLITKSRSVQKGVIRYNGFKVIDKLQNEYKVPPQVAESIDILLRKMLNFDPAGRISLDRVINFSQKLISLWDDLDLEKKEELDTFADSDENTVIIKSDSSEKES